MNIRFYKNFSKRKNSTKRPSVSDNYNGRNCYLKEDTSIDNPSIVLSNREGNASQTGNPITTSNAIVSNANSCSVSFSPTQTYNGYDKPWAPGTEKNKLVFPYQDSTTTINGITFTVNSDGSIKLSGTASANATFFIASGAGDATQYNGMIMNGITGGSLTSFFWRISDVNISSVSQFNGDTTISGLTNTGVFNIFIRVVNGYTFINPVTIYPMIRPSYITDGTFAPYANICAINGKTGINLNVNGTTITEPFGQTVYGGVWNVISGSVRDDWDVIASYNGESLPGEWFSSMDLYSSINPPTTGAEVVYKVTTPTSFTIPGHVVPLNENANTLSANADSISINYDISTSGDIPLNYTYAYIDHLKKYYFVNAPVILTDGTIQYDLIEDVLATHKTAIGSTVAQISYSSTGYDIWKADTRLPVKVTKTITKSSGSAGVFNGTGTYILGVSNVDAGTSAVCYYAMSQAELQAFMTEVATDTNMKTAVQNYCADLWDAIISCTWVPFSSSEIPGASDTIKVANYTCTATGRKISNPPTRGSSVTLSIPWTYSDFRRNPPYTTLSAWIPGFGYTTLNAGDLVSDTSLKFDFMIDGVTGDVCCNIIDAVNSNILQSISYNAGVSVPLSRYTMDVQGIITSTTNVLGNATDTVIAGGLLNPAGVASGVISTLGAATSLAIAANTRDVSIKGTSGGRAIIAEGIDVELYAFSVNTEDPDDANYIARWGRPVGVTHAINNHSGYVQCDGASVAIAGDTMERDEINSYLNSGFYYE